MAMPDMDHLPDDHILKYHWCCKPSDWVPFTVSTYLSHHIVVAATTRIEGKWKAYIKDIDWTAPREEAEKVVLSFGATLEPKIALAIFPQFAGVPYDK